MRNAMRCTTFICSSVLCLRLADFLEVENLALDKKNWWSKIDD